MILIIFNEQLKIISNSIIKNSLILSYHWQKFECWLQDIILHDSFDKLKLLKKFIITCQLLKEDLNQFYLRLFNLEIQSEHIVSMKNYHTRLLKSFQNLMNQHDHKYSIIQHAVIYADKLWQTLNKEKICLKFKKERKKTQHQCENFNQHHHDNFQLQNQNKKYNSY